MFYHVIHLVLLSRVRQELFQDCLKALEKEFNTYRIMPLEVMSSARIPLQGHPWQNIPRFNSSGAALNCLSGNRNK